MPQPIVFVAHVVTETLNEGFLIAARELGLDPVIVTDLPGDHRRHFSQEGLAAYPEKVLGCDVFNPIAIIETLQEADIEPKAVFSHSDHLQAPTAIAAGYLGLPGKDWRVCFAAKNKAAMRQRFDELELSPCWHRLVTTRAELTAILPDCPFPCVIKPREGVSSLNVSLVETQEALIAGCEHLWQKHSGQPLLIEEYLQGELYTLETLGDGDRIEVLGGFRVNLSPPPHFIELAAHWGLDLAPEIIDEVVDQIRRFGIGFGSCHTEFVVTPTGPRLIEINYRTIGDGREFLLDETLGIELFRTILNLHLGEALPQLNIARKGLHIEYIRATRSGRLVQIPGPFRRRWEDGFIDFRPLRQTGESLKLSHSNKDYLGVIRASGDSTSSIKERVSKTLASLEWEIQP
ncbi:ATP-grasp domain-containing protein [Guyparkeria hydrothermalis]|uniref:ATP-grasp domain-containing protein n=1 Tax=Guyparkeria TaxID=2035712 RepID=UPI0010AB8795|nr:MULTISPECIES: ATP-grasp domain-containing protein [Guyparkeria]MCL7750272.1 ATP-grasp domain-containing protein [Guyparkeria hydrothermalis]TKA88503.1 ATP-grasp domain-containing protein [Guyparkeria sp. SB14A]